MKKIIHPTDFSDNASKAFEYAIGLCKKFDAELILLNIGGLATIWNSSPTAISFSEMEEGRKADIVEELKKYAANYIDKAGSNLKIQFMAKLNSSTANGIIEAINDTDADMVLMGMKGENKFKQIIVGSTTKALVTLSPCPVLAIPENAVLSELKHIVYASDFDQNDIAAIKKLIPDSQIHNTKITVLHIFRSKSEDDAEAVAFQKQLAHEVKYLPLKYDGLLSDDVPNSLVSYLNINQADLLVMFEKEYKGIAGLFHKNISRQFVLQKTVPLMTFNIHSVYAPNKV